MYGFCRLGLRPAPSRGAVCVANGLETATSMNAKKTDDAAEHRHGPRDEVGARRRLSSTAAAEYPLSTSSQRSSEPSCPPQKADIE